MKLLDWIKTREVVVVSGPGGVGKTTASAAIALSEARRGRKVLVLTIDPARRLAGALGLDCFESEARRVPLETIFPDTAQNGGSLDAMMLDVKAEWDSVMHRYAPTPDAPVHILQNRLYQYISDNLVGAQEFMAMERLHFLHSQGKYDLIVLDTPPTKHALDFLEAPRKLFQFLEDGTFVKVFIESGRGGRMRLLKIGTSAVFAVLEPIIGKNMIGDIREFVGTLEGYYEGFRTRARATNDLLRSEKTLFFLVTAPTPLALSETRYFHEKLVEAQIPFGGFLFNRVHGHSSLSETDRKFASHLFGDSEERARLLGRVEGDQQLGPDWARLVGSLGANFMNLETLAEVEEKKLAAFKDVLTPDQVLIKIPFLDHDIHNPAGLNLLNSYLFG